MFIRVSGQCFWSKSWTLKSPLFDNLKYKVENTNNETEVKLVKTSCKASGLSSRSFKTRQGQDRDKTRTRQGQDKG